MNIMLERARDEDAQAITDLMNKAYRGDDGWTTEQGLVSGERIQIEAVEQDLQNDKKATLVAFNRGELLTCVTIEQSSHCAVIGSFAVDPAYQGLGIGRSVLQQAEEFAIHVFKVKCLKMLLLEQRPELLAYYQRRGYCLTVEKQDFPSHLAVGKLINQQLKIMVLKKDVK